MVPRYVKGIRAGGGLGWGSGGGGAAGAWQEGGAGQAGGRGRAWDRLETEMSRDQFEDLVRKVKLAIATRLQTSASGAAILGGACQVS